MLLEKIYLLRFWSRIDIRGEDECWEWTAARQPRGYGVIVIEGKRRLATHVMWAVYHGEWPWLLGVLHKCDNPPCVNPNHLFLGTQLDNWIDSKNKGRSVNPPPSPTGKLTDDQVIEIRASKQRKKILAEKYGISRNQVWMVQSGRSWKNKVQE